MTDYARKVIEEAGSLAESLRTDGGTDSPAMRFAFEAMDEMAMIQLPAEDQRPVFDYRLTKEESNPPIAQLGKCLVTFQDLVDKTFSALQRGVPTTGRVASAVKAKSALRFNHAYEGSVGLVLEVPEMDLMADSIWPDAIATIAEMAHASTPSEVRNLSERFGATTLRAAQEWFLAHEEYGSDAELEYIGTEHQAGASVSLESMIRARVAFAITEESDQDTLDIEGKLVGWHVEKSRFWFSSEEEGYISGSIDQTLLSRTVEVPADYRAIMIIKRSRGALAQDSTTEYVLVNLLPTKAMGGLQSPEDAATHSFSYASI